MKRSSALAIFALAIALYCLLPFLWFVLTSFKTPADLAAIPPRLVPSLHWGFYHSALFDHGLARYIGNSLIVAGAATLISIAIGSMAAYAISRFQLAWTRFYLLALLAISMFPQIAIAGPVWNILNRLDWLNTYYGLVTAYIARSPGRNRGGSADRWLQPSAGSAQSSFASGRAGDSDSGFVGLYSHLE
jgi:multiple sugar transport system permease protein